jgi:outer membrane protein assembly factor BamB
MATCVVALASASAAVAAPCSTTPAAGGEWPSYGHDAANTRTQPEATGFGPSAVAGVTAKWTFSTSSTGDGTGFNTTPVVDGGCAFIGSYGGVAYALDAGTGHVVWQRKVDAPNPGSGGVIVGAAAVDGSSVVFLVDEFSAPYAIALNRSTGEMVSARPGPAHLASPQSSGETTKHNG